MFSDRSSDTLSRGSERGFLQRSGLMRSRTAAPLAKRGDDLAGLRLRRRSRPIIAAASVLLIVLSIAVASNLYEQAGARRSVLEVDHAIGLGSRITAQDLVDVRISVGSGVAAVPSSAASQVVGRPSGVTVPRGSLLVWGDVAHGAVVPPGEAIVGVSLKSGQLPATGVTSGESVEVVLVPPAGQAVQAGGSYAGDSSPAGAPAAGTLPPAGALVLARAVIAGVGATSSQAGLAGTLPTAGTGQTVSLEVSLSDAPLIAAAAAEGQVALVLITGITGSSLPGHSRPGVGAGQEAPG